MAKDPKDAIVAEFSRWAAAQDRDLAGTRVADAAEVDLLLGLIRDQLGLDDPARLGPGDIEDLLLNIYPRKVTVFDPEEAEGTVPAVRDLLAFLADTGRLSDKTARRLGQELDRVAPRFADAVMDPSRWGMARSFMHAMAADGVDIEDSEAVQDWIDRQNNPYNDWDDNDDEIEDLREAFGLPDRLPPMRLPDLDELAALARKSPLLAAACRLAEWVGPRRAVDEEGGLLAADTVAAAAELGLETGDPSAITAMDDVPELVHLWDLAFGAGFLEDEDEDEDEDADDDDDTVVAVGEAVRLWHSGTDAEALAIWADALAFMATESLDVDAALDDQWETALDLHGAGVGVLTLLFLARSLGLTVAAANELIRDGAADDLPAAEAARAWAVWTQAHGEPADVLLGRLAELGAVSLHKEEEGPVARLTPLGSWAVRGQLTASGVDIPLLPPPAEMTAADLVAAAESAPEEETSAETDAWLALRDPGAAARELLDFAAASRPAERMRAVTAARRIGAAAEPAWRAALDVQALSPYAKMALSEISPLDLEPEPAEAAWLLIDLLAATSEAFEPEDLEPHLAEAVPRDTAEPMFDAMSRLPHPDAAQALTLIGQHHPDKKVAKAARRYAYKATSRLNARR